MNVRGVLAGNGAPASGDSVITTPPVEGLGSVCAKLALAAHASSTSRSGMTTIAMRRMHTSRAMGGGD